MTVAKAEEHQVAIEVQEVGLPERKVLMDESQIGKTPRTRIENVSWYGLPLHVYHCQFSLVPGMVRMGLRTSPLPLM